MSATAGFAARKVGGALLTLGFVVVVNFFLFRVISDDPVGKLFRGRNLTREQIQAKREQFDLDGSQFQQFVAYIKQTLQGNLGDSILSGRPVTTEIREAIWPTVMLVGTSTILSMLIGILFGIYSGWRRRSAFDAGATTFSMFTYSVPDFWLGMLLLSLFGVTLGWFPIGGLQDPTSDATGIALLGACIWEFARLNQSAAFLSRAYRENDYLLGRLHAIDRLIDIVCDSAGADCVAEIDIAALKRRAFTQVLDAEEKHLGESKDLIAALRRCVAEIVS